MKLLALAVLVIVLFGSVKTYAHCEVPCGIYDDQLRIELIREHITTIEKAMTQIRELESQNPVNYNQVVRWINTKEDHASEIQHIADQYFMTQRIKPVEQSDEEKYKKYILQLTSIHELMIYSMKSKQTVDQEWIDKMRETVDRFEIAYFGERSDLHKH